MLEKSSDLVLKNELTEESAVLVSHAGLNFGDTQIDIEESRYAQSEVNISCSGQRRTTQPVNLRGVVTARLKRIDQIRPESRLDRDL